MVATYRPPIPAETPQAEDVWMENLMETISSWRSIKEVFQEVLDRMLGAEILHTSGALLETQAPGLSEEEKKQTFLAMGIPAGTDGVCR